MVVFTICAIPVFVLDILLYMLSLVWLPKLLFPRGFYSVAAGEATATHGAAATALGEAPAAFVVPASMTIAPASALPVAAAAARAA